MIDNTYTSSIAPTVLFGGGSSPYDALIGYHIRTISASPLASVSVTFSWIDDRGVTLSVNEILALNLLNNSVQKAFPLRLGLYANFVLSSTLLLGPASYNIAYGQIGFN